MCIAANRELPADVRASFEAAHAAEEAPAAKEIFRQLLENADLARDTGLPLCQDCGLGVFFVEVGEEGFEFGGRQSNIERNQVPACVEVETLGDIAASGRIAEAGFVAITVTGPDQRVAGKVNRAAVQLQSDLVADYASLVN